MELVKEITRRGQQILVIDFTWLDSQGKRRRYRRDAEIQGKTAAQVEAKRRLTAATYKGSPFAITDAGARQAEIDNTPPPPPPAPTSPTLDSAIQTYWSTFAITHLKASSRETYRTQLDFWISPLRASSAPRHRNSRQPNARLRTEDGLGHLPIASIDASVVAAWDARMVLAGASRVSRRLAQIVLRSIVCKWAVDVARLLPEAPRMPELPSGSKKRRFVPSAEQTETILAQAGGASRKVAVLLGVDAGCRTCEIKALRVCDVDFGRREITIRQARVGQTTDTPKSHAERRVPLTDRLHAALVAAATGKLPSDFLTVSERGTQWGEGTIREMLVRVCKKAALPRITTHHLRHAFATSVLRAGAPITVVQRLMGHASITTTALYLHCDEADSRRAIEALQAAQRPVAAVKVARPAKLAHASGRGKNAVTASRASA